VNVEQVKRLPPLGRFLYWCRERHAIYLRRQAGKPRPWTDDEVLRSYFFTNPYRENDKVTAWFRENIRQPLRDDPRVLMATVIFRWFNLPETAVTLMGPQPKIAHKDWNLLLDWDPTEALGRLSAVRAAGSKIFTGAYLVNSPGRRSKLEAVVDRITGVWKAREWLSREMLRGAREDGGGLEFAHELLTRFEGLAGFTAYEVVCDLRYTMYLDRAPDVLTWCNIGPGARRGLYRVLGLDFPKGNNGAGCPRLLKPRQEMEEMRKLLATCYKRLGDMPRFEMREVEMSLCEFDKYERALWQDGRLKRRYNGV
jgi:hypothetical protein